MQALKQILARKAEGGPNCHSKPACWMRLMGRRTRPAANALHAQIAHPRRAELLLLLLEASAGAAGSSHARSASATRGGGGRPEKLGSMPLRSMSTRPGVRYLPTVMTRPELSLSSYTLWMRPLPYVRLPTSTARQLSLSAPA